MIGFLRSFARGFLDWRIWLTFILICASILISSLLGASCDPERGGAPPPEQEEVYAIRHGIGASTQRCPGARYHHC